MAAFVQESELVSFFIYRPELGRKEGTVRNPQKVLSEVCHEKVVSFTY